METGKQKNFLKSCIGYQLLTLLFLRFLAEEDHDHFRLQILYISEDSVFEWRGGLFSLIL